MPEPREPLRPDVERGLSLGLAALAAAVAITCGSQAQIDRGATRLVSAPSASGAPMKPAPAPLGAPSSSAGVAGAAHDPSLPASAGAAIDPTRLDLLHFYAELAGLAAHTRKTPVRVLWLGDSHTAADYLTGELRARLEARFGAGGPGFVRIAVKHSRHSQVHLASEGAWRIEPPQPSRRAPFDDGVLGLGGMRAVPGDAPAFASFEVSKGVAHGELRWQLWFAAPEGASFRLDLAGVSQVVTHATSADSFPGSGLTRLALRSALGDKFSITTLGGAPRFFGLIVEGSEPGVVLDAVGIDGARVATALAWGEQSFETAVAARSPSLLALAFGTNEAFDADNVEKYRAQYQELLGRVRKASPAVDCLIVGPPDANAANGGSEPRVKEIDALEQSVAGELGCGYLSQLSIMGGPGSYTHWANKLPPLARGDRLHLTPKGYEIVADALADKLLDAYARSPAASAVKPQ